MHRVIAVLSLALVALLSLPVPAQADTVGLPYGGTATLTIPDVTVTPGAGCIHNYGTLTISHIDNWDVTITANGPTTWPASDFLYGYGPLTKIVDLQICPSFDQPGLYTASGLLSVEDPYSYNTQEVVISDQFVVSHPTPPPPPPAPPAPPAPLYSDVTGSVANKSITSGVRLTFRSDALPAGTTMGNELRWKVTYGGRTTQLTQGPSEVDTVPVRFAAKARGRHVVKVFRNGIRVLTTTVRIR
jgi:hypothetical protein